MKNLKILSFCTAVLAISGICVFAGVNKNAAIDVADTDFTKTEYITTDLNDNSSETTVTDENTEPISEFSEVQTVTDISTEPLKEYSDQEMVWHKMLNSIDYYDSISGTTVYNVGRDVNNCVVVDFESDVVSGKAYANVSQVNANEPYKLLNTTNSLKNNITVISDGKDVYELDNINRTYDLKNGYAFTREETSVIPDDERYWIDENGDSCCIYRSNATNIDYAKRCVFSQEMAIGYLYDFDLWTVDEIGEYNGRKCYIVSGKPDEEYGAKLNVDNFTFYVDYETGVLLKYEGYSSDGVITDFLYTDNIEVNKGISSDITAITADLSGYTDITRNRAVVISE